MYNEYQDKFFNRLADEFETIHPEVDVVIERVTGGSWVDFQISLINDYWNGTPPDVAQINADWLQRFINAGLLDPAPDDLGQYLKSQPVSDTLKSILYKDNVPYGVIHIATWQSLYYNKAQFREVGLDPNRPPQNWGELLDYAKKLTVYDADGKVKRAGFSLRKSGYAPGTAQKFLDFYFSAGGVLFDKDNKQCLMNSDAGVRALQFYLDCLYTDKVDGFEVVGDTDGFAHGTVSMFFRDPWVIKNFHDNVPDLDYGVADITPDKISSSNGGFQPLVVASNSPHKKLAWDFVRYMTRPEAMAEYSANEMQAPFDAVAKNYPEFQTNDAFRIFLEQQNVQGFPQVKNSDQIQTIIGNTVESVCRANSDPKAALDQMVAKINPLLATSEKKGSISPKVVSGYLLGILLIGFLSYIIVWWQRDKSGRWGFILIAPMIVYFAIFFIYPILSSLILSFWDYNPLEPVSPFIGLDNYKSCLTDPVFLLAFKNTAVYSFWTVLLGTVISLALAIAMNKALEAVGLYRTLFFIPVVTSIMGSVLVWKYLYQPDATGLFNMLLVHFHIGKQIWLQNEKMALGCVIAMAVWKNMGFNMIIFLAGLKAIPEIYYEAASIDGASGWQKFKHITLPSLRPTVLFVVVTSLISTFQVFTQIVGMTEGGPNNATRTIVYHIYEAGFKDFRLGYASAAAVIMLIVVGFITWLQFRIAKD
jgi:ABC-type sugar transport system permease subunit/ABC-type glycerol-3-phosphate transport system substrate-binding protein